MALRKDAWIPNAPDCKSTVILWVLVRMVRRLNGTPARVGNSSYSFNAKPRVASSISISERSVSPCWDGLAEVLA